MDIWNLAYLQLLLYVHALHSTVVNVNLCVYLAEGSGGVLHLLSVLSSSSMMSLGSGLLENTQMVS